jgi:hypothetical protein
MKRAPIQRHKELARSAPMVRRARRLAPAAAMRRLALIRQRRESGAVWTAVRRVVWVRCEGRCERCGTALEAGAWDCHHRKPRARGGRDEVVNAVALCPSCHTGGPLAVHRRELPAGARGLMLRRHENPALVPVMIHTGQTLRLMPGGSYDHAVLTEEST